jgi:hypothetical protein
MDKKSKILLVLVFIIGCISIGFTFYKTVILKDFQAVNTEENTENVSI